jgi:ATP-dependent Clp protease ATP-binding subunit ClpA
MGEPGGQTAIAEGLALKIIWAKCPRCCSQRRFRLDLGAVLAGTKYRGEFEKRFKGVITALQKIPGSICSSTKYIQLSGPVHSGGSMDASNISPALASGELRCIGSTTYSEYKASFERDRAPGPSFKRLKFPKQGRGNS